MTSISNAEPAAAGASTKENPRLAYATGSTGLAITVRGSSRRIMIMRFRPANIRLINRRSKLLRLLLALSSGKDKSNDNDKNNPQLCGVDTVTPYQAESLRHKHIETPQKENCHQCKLPPRLARICHD